jgi:hypothetical protein
VVNSRYLHLPILFPNHGNALQRPIYALAIPSSSGRIKSLPTFTQSGPSRPPRYLELLNIDTIPLFMIHILDINIWMIDVLAYINLPSIIENMLLLDCRYLIVRLVEEVADVLYLYVLSNKNDLLYIG